MCFVDNEKNMKHLFNLLTEQLTNTTLFITCWNSESIQLVKSYYSQASYSAVENCDNLLTFYRTNDWNINKNEDQQVSAVCWWRHTEALTSRTHSWAGRDTDSTRVSNSYFSAFTVSAICESRTKPHVHLDRVHCAGTAVSESCEYLTSHTPSGPERGHRGPVGSPNTPHTHAALHPSAWLPQQRLPLTNWAPVSLFYSEGLQVALTLLHRGICCFHLWTLLMLNPVFWGSLYCWWKLEVPWVYPVWDGKNTSPWGTSEDEGTRVLHAGWVSPEGVFCRQPGRSRSRTGGRSERSSRLTAASGRWVCPSPSAAAWLQTAETFRRKHTRSATSVLEGFLQDCPSKHTH